MAHTLTNREQEILSFIVTEYSSCEIAAKLQLSVRTVETHRKNIYRKTQTSNLVGLMKYSIRMGMMEGYYFDNSAVQAAVRPMQNFG